MHTQWPPLITAAAQPRWMVWRDRGLTVAMWALFALVCHNFLFFAADEVRVAVGHEGNRVTVDIVDEGVGMTPEFVRDTLFRPFGTAKRGGTGIGAFQARELLREAGGDLLVISRPGEGTTMRAVLPAVGGA
jgi:signal transduction histidine kinase